MKKKLQSDENKPSAKMEQPLVKSANTFPVVGIGASAGGLDAFKKLLNAIPENSGMAFVLVQHLDPQHDSLLPELLQKVANIPVMEITDDMKVLPDHIYIIPSNKMLVANDGVLLLSPRSSNKNERNLPIDLFFTSLAEVHQSHSIGVVLSGTASDGTKGLKAIKDQGGITFAQSEDSAAFGGMPQSAIQAGVVDFILPPEEIPQKLLEIIRIINDNSEAIEDPQQQEEEIFKQMLALLRVRKGTDFTYYKQSTIRRRIFRRMALNKNEVPATYLKFLRENKKEQDILFQDLLIPVTSFFRDIKSFNHLCETVFPQIIKNKKNGEFIRVWIAGCSTGQEVYSVAICLKELLGEQKERVQIFATDISEPAITKARQGIYLKSEVDGLTPRHLQDFFTKNNGGYQANKSIRDICVFAVHNFLKDPPFGKMDLISCRNVLIYMEPYLQKKALTTFHYALNQPGFLLLGKSETITGVPDLFSISLKGDKLFSRKDVPGKYMHTATLRHEQSITDVNIHPKTDPDKSGRTDFQKLADDIMLSKYTPVGVVVNEEMDIVHFRGKTGKYLESLPGKPSHNLLKMARDGLSFELRNIISKAKKEKTSVIKDNIPVNINGDLNTISIEAMPLPDTIEPHYLVLFHETQLVSSRQSAVGKKQSAKQRNDDKDLRIVQLEKELAQAREDMRSITEDQEAINEELQSANEELLSGSEELQSLNEELETGKEELQSTNEELSVVNQEMIGLNEQVTEARDYAEAIITTIREPLLVLDRNLRVKSANRAFYKTFQVNEMETEGRLVYQLGDNQWNIPELRTLMEEILPKKTLFADFEVSSNFPHIGDRVMRLNAREITREKIEEKLILLAIEDVTEKVNAQKKIEVSEHRYHNMIYSSTSLIAILKGEDNIISIANDAIIEIWGKGKGVIGKPFLEALPELEEQNVREELYNVYTTGIPSRADERPVKIVRHGKMEILYYSYVFQPQRNADGIIEGIAIIGSEVTTQALFNKKIKESEEKFSTLAENMENLAWIADGEGYTYWYNKRWYDFTGTTLEEMQGWGWQKMHHPDHVERVVDFVKKAWQKNEAFELTFPLRGADGAYKWFLTRVFPIVGEDGKATRWIGTNTDITEQKKQKEALEEAVVKRTYELKEANQAMAEKNIALQNKNKEMEAFTYISSHDLQEPLRKIQTFAGLILEKENQKLSDSGKDYLRRIQEAGLRMRMLIQDLLAFSRLNTTERIFETTNLKSIIEEVTKELKETIAEKHAVIEVKVLFEVSIIPFQFRQLMHNLIGNALKFSNPAIPPHITIECHHLKYNKANNEHLQPGKEYTLISVTDNGIGFEKEYSEIIFEVFQRLHGKEEYPGTGIGLAIVKKIVENHHGIITATSELNKGTTFDIYIPV